jgi:hypothetical protein
MSCDRGFLHNFRVWTVPGYLLRIRGELAIGAQLRAAKLVCGRSVWILTMMQSCASAAKLRAAGPFSPSAFGATSATGSRHLGSSTGNPVVDASSERRAGKEMILQRFVSLPDAG